jgi:hypothetical protein
LSSPGDRAEVARHLYRHSDGRPAFEIRRYQPKAFLAFQPDGQAGAVPLPPLYRAGVSELT